MIDQIGTIFVPVTDQERSLGFYVDKLGFAKRVDVSYSAGRWIEVAPHESPVAIALVPEGEGRAVAPDQVHCALATKDIDAAHARLRKLGVDIDPEIAGTGTGRAGLISPKVGIAEAQPPQVVFRDPDGNRFLLVQVPE